MWPFTLKKENKLLKEMLVNRTELIALYKAHVIDTKKVYLYGARVMCRSNAQEPMLIGMVVGFQDTKDDTLPIVQDEATGKQWAVSGIVRPYNEAVFMHLSAMTPAQQWKYFAPDSAYVMEDK